MKKLLLLSAVIFSTFVLAQQSKFSGNYSTKSLKEIHKTVPENEKSEFYKQYFRALYFEDMKDVFNYKNYSDIILKKFTDTILSHYDGGEVVSNDNEVFKPSTTWDKYLEDYNAYLNIDPKETDSLIAKTLLFRDKEEKKKFFEGLKVQMGSYFDKAEKSPEQLKKEYEELIAVEKENFENDQSTSIGLKTILYTLDQQFATQETSEEFRYLLQKNFSSSIGFGNYLPYPSNEAGEASAFESLPGEILTYATETGTAEGRSFHSYKITGDNIIPITIDSFDDNFYKKVSKYAKTGWRTEPRAFYTIEKNKIGEYVISTGLYTVDDFSTAPSMSIEYKTTDFKSFTPLRIAKNEDDNLVWKKIK
ncbi:hypothetical protein [Chryseobacterium turcicum]|uniref:Uncharacterized protein n=1 Tax=Chryseobacterium turcicum TaxID=2898076 RepID=A0A9Q3V7R1_9FLAO|nr:hypothetical protein [Chryseobacterium turcicum]MCD1119179.1 hypothetical protein [Chryseobacterium turcicum]